MKIIKKWLVLPLMVIAFSVSAQNADEIVARYFEAIGGVNTWKNLSSIRVTGKLPTPQGDLTFTICRKAPNLQKVSYDAFGTDIVSRAFDGTKAWSQNPMTGNPNAVLMSEEETADISDQEFEPALVDYKKKGHGLTFNGEADIDGMKCFKITLTKNKNNKDDIDTEYYFDKENYLLIMQKETVRSGPAKGNEVESHLSDYQDVGGLMYPHFLEQKIGGRSVAKLIVEKVELNAQLENSLFAYPGK